MNQPTSCFLTYLSLRESIVRISLGALFLLLASCQSYQSSPLDPEVHRKAWRNRSDSDERVMAFARRLERSPPRSVNFSPENGLSLTEGEIVALVYNPDLRVARLKAGVARAVADHAARWDDPQINFNVLKILESVPNPWFIASSVTFTFPVSGRLAVEKSRASAASYSELAKVAEEEWRVLRDLRKTWIDWSANQLRLTQTQKMIRSLDSLVKMTNRLVELGELPRTEARLFQIEQETRRAEEDRLLGKIKQGEQEIRAYLGLSPTASVRLVSSPTEISQGESTSVSQTNPTVIRLQNDYQVAELTLLREIREQFPDLNLGPSSEEEEERSRVGLIGAIPLPVLNANKGGIAKARAEREVARAAYESQIERTEGKLAARRAELSGIRARRKSLKSKVVPLVDQQIADARKLLEIGEGNSLVYLESLIRAHEAKLSLIAVSLDESLTLVEINHLLGPSRFVAQTK